MVPGSKIVICSLSLSQKIEGWCALQCKLPVPVMVADLILEIGTNYAKISISVAPCVLSRLNKVFCCWNRCQSYSSTVTGF